MKTLHTKLLRFIFIDLNSGPLHSRQTRELLLQKSALSEKINLYVCKCFANIYIHAKLNKLHRKHFISFICENIALMTHEKSQFGLKKKNKKKKKKKKKQEVKVT